MNDNTVISEDGIEIYTNEINRLSDEYIISELNNPDDIYNKQCFAGMIKYISMNIRKPDYSNLVLLDKLWNIYTSLCYKYKQTVSIERYCLLIGISRQTFYSWFNEETMRDYSEVLGSSRSDMMKKWDNESESSWQDEASTGNPGAMFVLKARRGWQETAPALVSASSQTHRTPEQIAADYGAQAALPGDVQPDF